MYQFGKCVRLDKQNWFGKDRAARGTKTHIKSLTALMLFSHRHDLVRRLCNHRTLSLRGRNVSNWSAFTAKRGRAKQLCRDSHQTLSNMPFITHWRPLRYQWNEHSSQHVFISYPRNIGVNRKSPALFDITIQTALTLRLCDSLHHTLLPWCTSTPNSSVSFFKERGKVLVSILRLNSVSKR